MPSWIELLNEIDAQSTDELKSNWLNDTFIQSLLEISKLRNGRNVILYGSSFLQKPTTSGFLLQISYEDINGFMSVIHGMDCTKGLSLIMHTPGGITNATESIVSYLRSKFNDIEVIIPTFAMSAGTMISLSADKIIMGRQSQLGPIDPQMPVNGRFVSAIAILEQFNEAKDSISQDVTMAHLWAPILSSLGPALVQEAQNAISYSEQIVAEWLTKYLFKGQPNATKKGLSIAKHFNQGTGNNHRKKSHGRRIDRDEAELQGLVIEHLENSQNLQEKVLTAYHLMTIIFEKSPAVKIISGNNKTWVKNS